MLDEGEPSQVPPGIAPLVAMGALRRGQQADLFVVADRLDLDACAFSQTTDGDNLLDSDRGDHHSVRHGWKLSA